MLDLRGSMPIQSFVCKETEILFTQGTSSKFRSIERVATRKLQLLNTVLILEDLRACPGNKLHLLTKGRNGQYAIRINDQYRICFFWTPAGPENVEITDYH